MCAVGEIRQQERLHELAELDDAADDVLANAVQDTEAKALLANNLEHDRLKLRPALTSPETCNRLARFTAAVRQRPTWRWQTGKPLTASIFEPSLASALQRE